MLEMWGLEAESGMNLSSSPILSVCHCTIGGRVGSQGARGGALRVMSELVPLPIGMPSPHSQQWHTFFFFFSCFIYFWLCWVFVAVLGLSLVVASGDYSQVTV